MRLSYQTRTAPGMTGIAPGFILLLVLFAEALTLTTVCCAATSTDTSRHVLILNSYHKQFKWSDDIVEAIEQTLLTEYQDLIIHLEYLDTKRHSPSTEYLKQMAGWFTLKYTAVQPDVIITIDNNALQFTVEYHDLLFPGIPVVFCGINDFNESMLGNLEQVTGVTESKDLSGTITLAKQIQPQAEHLVIITDTTPTGLIDRQLAEKAAGGFPELKLITLSGGQYTLNEINSELKQIPTHAIVLFMSLWKDKTGQYLNLADTLAAVALASPSPVYTHTDFMLQQGILGGKLNTADYQGRQAASMAASILRGQDASDIAIIYDARTICRFDYNAITRHRISTSLLPAGSELINEPPSFNDLYNQHRYMFWLIISLFSFMLILLGFLSTNVMRRRHIEKLLRESESEKAVILDGLAENVSYQDTEMRVRWANQTAIRSTGLTAEQIMGRHCYEIWGDRDTPCENCPVIRCIHSGQMEQEEHITPDGRAWFISASPVRDDTGSIIGAVESTLNITEHKKAEEALRENENLLRTIINATQDAMISIKEDGCITLFNPAAENMFGRTREEMIGRPLDKLMPESYRVKHREYIKSYFTTGKPDDAIGRILELPGMRSDGDEFPMSISLAAGKLDDEQFVIAVARDITERKQAEDALRKAHDELEQRVADRTAELRETNLQLHNEIAERLHAESQLHDNLIFIQKLIDTIPNPIFYKQTNGAYQLCNRAFEQMLGLSRDQIIDRTVFELIDHEKAAMLADKDQQLWDNPGVQVYESQLLYADGDMHDVVFNKATVLDSDGNTEGLVGVILDITERKTAETALHLVQSAIEQVGEAVVITDSTIDDPGPRIVYANQAFHSMTGYNAQEVTGKTFQFLHGPKTSTAAINQLYQAMQAEQHFIGELTNYRKDGTEYELELHIAPVRDTENRVTHWVSIQRDITEKKEHEGLIKQHQAELAHVTRLSTMGEMASGMAHELNQPLAAIMNYTQGLQQRMNISHVDSHLMEETLQRIAHQAERAGEILRRLRVFVHKREPRRIQISAHHMVREVLELVDFEVRRHHVDILCNFNEELPQVKVDTIQIEQIILNLIRNAIEAMETNNPADRRIGIATSRHDASHICISVSDHGQGMTDYQMDHIFDPFYSTKKNGMGMGLTISESIAQAHNGRLLATRRPDQGMTFQLILPAGN